VIINKKNLARFGYRLNMKKKKKTESFNILGYLLELIIKIWQSGKKKKIRDLPNLGHFFHAKSFA